MQNRSFSASTIDSDDIEIEITLKSILKRKNTKAKITKCKNEWKNLRPIKSDKQGIFAGKNFRATKVDW